MLGLRIGLVTRELQPRHRMRLWPSVPSSLTIVEPLFRAEARFARPRYRNAKAFLSAARPGGSTRARASVPSVRGAFDGVAEANRGSQSSQPLASLASRLLRRLRLLGLVANLRLDGEEPLQWCV